MNRREALMAINPRMTKPENANRLKSLKADQTGEASRICWHYKRATESLKYIESSNAHGIRLQLAKLDFSVSIKRILYILDKQEWA